MTITAAADGSALGNPGPAGWAWYVDDGCWAAGGWDHATNNRGELQAVLELFLATASIDDDLLVLCDSQYVINSVTKWMRGWKAKGWRKSDGKPVMNVDLLQQLDAALDGRRFRFEWVKGHANHPLNEAADSRARAAAEAFQRKSAVLFRINCAMCHNVAGAGGALTQGKFAPALAGVESVHVYEAMVTGPQNMPVFNDMNITPDEKADIITYLKYLDDNPSPGGFDLGSLGPVSEGLFVWIFGLGAIVGVTIWIAAKSN